MAAARGFGAACWGGLARYDRHPAPQTHTYTSSHTPTDPTDPNPTHPSLSPHGPSRIPSMLLGGAPGRRLLSSPLLLPVRCLMDPTQLDSSPSSSALGLHASARLAGWSTDSSDLTYQPTNPPSIHTHAHQTGRAGAVEARGQAEAGSQEALPAPQGRRHRAVRFISTCCMCACVRVCEEALGMMLTHPTAHVSSTTFDRAGVRRASGTTRATGPRNACRGCG